MTGELLDDASEKQMPLPRSLRQRMILPRVGEAEWLSWLNCLPYWDAPAKPAVIVVPHPDDEVLGIGGLIRSLRRVGVKVTVVAVTDGEHAYEDVADNLAAMRRAEQDAALHRLLVEEGDVIRLGLPDGDVASFEKVLADKLKPFINRDETIFAPWRNDHHPDHEACGRAAEQVATSTGAKLVSYLFWAWHFKTPLDLDGLNVRRFELDPDLICAKQEALEYHQSQLGRRFGEPIIYPPLLAPAFRPFETFILEH